MAASFTAFQITHGGIIMMHVRVFSLWKGQFKLFTNYPETKWGSTTPKIETNYSHLRKYTPEVVLNLC
jgi:hypothetical protein